MVSNHTSVMASLAVRSSPSNRASTMRLLSKSTSILSVVAVSNSPSLFSIGKSCQTKTPMVRPPALRRWLKCMSIPMPSSSSLPTTRSASKARGRSSPRRCSRCRARSTTMPENQSQTAHVATT